MGNELFGFRSMAVNPAIDEFKDLELNFWFYVNISFSAYETALKCADLSKKRFHSSRARIPGCQPGDSGSNPLGTVINIKSWNTKE